MKPNVNVLMPVRFVEPEWQLPMTRFAMDAMRRCTMVPFNFVVAEHGGTLAKELLDDGDEHLFRVEDTTFVEGLNLGLSHCEAEFVVHTANDIFVRPGWLEAMLECFEIHDCGVSTLASSDLPEPLSARANEIVEGVYGPHMAFRREWSDLSIGANALDGSRAKRFDAAYEGIFSDTDLVMAHYAAGMRSYRNHRVVIDHLNRATYDGLHSKEAQEQKLLAARSRFERKFSRHSHLRMFRYLSSGIIV